MTTNNSDGPMNLGMVCTCEPAGIAEAADIRERATRRLEAGDDAIIGHPVQPGTFVTRLIQSMAVGIIPAVTINGIYCDQWFGIKAEDSGDEVFTVSCDDVESGLAWLYLVARARADERTLALAVSRPEAAGKDEAQVAAELEDGFDYDEVLNYRRWLAAEGNAETS